MEPDELSLRASTEDDNEEFFSPRVIALPPPSPEEEMVDAILRRAEALRNIGKRAASHQSMDNLPIHRLQSQYSQEEVNFFEDNFEVPICTNSPKEIKETEENYELDLSTTDMDSEYFSEGYFTEFTAENRPAYLRKPTTKYSKIDPELRICPKDWANYTLWLQVTKQTLQKAEDMSSPPTLRYLLFSHFYRLEIPILEITAENIASKEDWLLHSRVIYPNVVSFIQVPLDINLNGTWWCSGENEPSENYGSSYLCHIRQTMLEERKFTKKNQRIEEKRNFSKLLLKGEEIPIFDSQDLRSIKEKNKYINWAIKWLKSRKKSIPQKLRKSSAKFLVSLVYPNEKVAGLTNRLWETGVAHRIIRYAKHGIINIAEHVLTEQLALSDIIDRGSTGKVFMGRYNNLLIAAKVSNSSNVSFQIEDFRFEVALMCLLQHPNIAFCLAANVEGPNFVVVSEYFAKTNLRSVVLNEKEDLPWRNRIQILCDIAKGMEFMHKNKIIHRDLKTPNIIVSSDLSIKITDFGSSCFFGQQDKGVPIGTTEWMAPEMLSGGRYTEKVDVYSFGIIMYEVIARELPFVGKKTWEIPEFVLAKSRPQFSHECPYKLLHELTLSCWHHSPRKRPSFTMIKEKLESLIFKITKISNEKKMERDVNRSVLNAKSSLITADSYASTQSSTPPTERRGSFLRSSGGFIIERKKPATMPKFGAK